MMETKAFWQSKTIIFNGLGLALEVLQLLGQANIVGPESLALAMGVGNLILRFVTSQPVGLSDGGK